MITEDYVSFEIAKLLKEKGFNERLLTFYITDEAKKEGYFQLMAFTDDKIDNSHSDYCYLAPTHQMAMKWLRKIHNIFIIIEPHMYDYINEKNSSYVTSLWQGDNYYENITSKDYPTYEDACEATIKYCLENLI